MGQASARKSDVEQVRKRIGEAAATAMAALQQEVAAARLEHKLLAAEMIAFTKQLATAQEARARDRRMLDALTTRCERVDEQLEALAARLRTVQAFERVTIGQRFRWLFRGQFQERT